MQYQQFSISNTPEGYVVSVWCNLGTDNWAWRPLRNFGDRQGDAIDFRDIDCPKLQYTNLKRLVEAYNPDVRYKRRPGRLATTFIKQR